MYSRPIFHLASILFRPIARLIGMQLNFIPIYNLLWSTVSGLISTLGTGQTLRLLYRFNRTLRNGSTSLDSLIRRNNIASQLINDHFIRVLAPHVPVILNNRYIVIKIVYFIMMTLMLFIVRPIFNLLIRTIISALFSATCILWSESLRGIKVLYEYALAIRDVCAPYFVLPIPDVVKSNIVQINNAIQNNFTNKTKTVLLTGLILFTSVIGLDLLLPYNFENLPYIGWLFSNSYYYFLVPAIRGLREIFNYFNIDPLSYIVNVFSRFRR